MMANLDNPEHSSQQMSGTRFFGKDERSLPDIETQKSSHTSQIHHLTHLTSQYKDKISTLESQNSGLNRRVVELERALAAALAEKKALVASKSALMDRYTSLKRGAAQLEAFRKSIVSMVEYSPAVSTSLVLDPETSALTDLEKSVLLEAGSTTTAHLGSNPHHNPQGNITNTANLPESVPTTGRTDPLSMFRNSQHGRQDHFGSETLTQASSSSQTGHTRSSSHREYVTASQESNNGIRSARGPNQGQSHGNALSISTGAERIDDDDPTTTSHTETGALSQTTSNPSQKVPALSQTQGGNSDNNAHLGTPKTQSHVPVHQHDVILLEERTLPGEASFLDDKAITSLDLSGQALDYSLSSIQHDSKSSFLLDPHHFHTPVNTDQNMNGNGPTTFHGTSSSSSAGTSGTVKPHLSWKKSHSFEKDLTSLSQDNLTTTTTTTSLHFSQQPHPQNSIYSLYKQIKDVLPPSSFEAFAQTVGQFNAGRLSPHETVAEVKRIVGPGYLADQMGRLILSAIEK